MTAWDTATTTRQALLTWTTVAPLVVPASSWGRDPGPVLVGVVAAVLVGAVLVGAVLAAVHHAEVVAHRVGEPFGSLVLAVAVTVIEVGLILTLVTLRRGRGRFFLAVAP
ncbi:Ca2+:H+ antiporter [Geodermatophilus amargosae]|uniref:Ca2+:H+ antiporter n=1 Tax=Geodermatophilus amargosae TaxID=1296565 RepID=A0A1I6XZJ9_9ACTN|nr:hypothetical protein [Geodermatophilus amargosae]SFT43543.1 Ca2+:H+ antiporter [Geodermatophilus amargosae]